MTDPTQPGWSDPNQPYPPEPTTAPAYPYQQQPYPGGPYGQPMYAPPMNPATNGLAIASLVCAVLGLGPVAAILGHVARKQIRQTGEQGDGMALAGIIIGWIYTGLFVCICGGWLATMVAVGGAGVVGN